MKRILINATQTDERHLALVEGQTLLDYEIEIEGEEQRKGNIYNAVVTRIEPSQQACFVDYGEDREGLLPFPHIAARHLTQGPSPSQAPIETLIREGQELLVQLVEDAHDSQEAVLTTHLSLAGRYWVLKPHAPGGDGEARRSNSDSTAAIKQVMDQLNDSKGMAITARSAAIGRSAAELQSDLNYLRKLWDAIEGATVYNRGAYLIYQDSSLVIRTIRDYFQEDIAEILIDSEDIYEQALQFMNHVVPAHAAKVKYYDSDIPLFEHFQIVQLMASAYPRDGRPA
ncbi:ribonuclease E/G [Comamonas piscis]|uniref:Ribonuclease E/G n=1 Tax=Comamonas piscis TaxID=1562974 RepID=A0A7G5ELM8_9BURK|nr:ribonuclease E/G [Comamonas piscis]